VIKKKSGSLTPKLQSIDSCPKAQPFRKFDENLSTTVFGNHSYRHVARMGDSCDLSRALHMSIRGLPRTSASHLASDSGSRPSAAQSWPELSTAEDVGSSSWKRLRSSQGHEPQDRDDDDGAYRQKKKQTKQQM